MNGLLDALIREVEKMPVIDTHEHLKWGEEYAYQEGDDVLREYLTHYMRSDVISAGLKPSELARVLDHSLPIAERWQIVEPYWEAARYTGYGRALDLSVKGVYGIDGVNRATIEALNDAFLAAHKQGHYRHVLRDLCNIETSLLDVWTFRTKGESDLFRCVWQPLDFIMPPAQAFSDLCAALAERHGREIKTFDDWLGAFEAELDDVLCANGMRVLKCAIAYSRPLRFEEVEYARAKTLFDEVFAVKDAESKGFPRELQDYMMHYILGLANKRNLTIQFHTGLLEGNGNTLSNSDPSLLNNLFLKYADVDFDLFHISYPYQGVACALAKILPNVTIDMCWAHIISPAACVQALDDFLDAVPYNKISAFGGDYLFADGVYGHLHLARQNVCQTLAGKVQQGVLGADAAIRIARALFYDNPKRIFKL